MKTSKSKEVGVDKMSASGFENARKSFLTAKLSGNGEVENYDDMEMMP